MRNLLHNLHFNHRQFWRKENLPSLAGGFILLIISLGLQRIANNYVFGLKGTAVEDLILNYLPTIDIDYLIIVGPLLLTGLALFLGLSKPKYLIFGLKALAIFIIVRSFLISLTHLGAMPHQLILDPASFGFDIYNALFNTSNDFFFSGHTGMPFLLALVFWPEKFWRYVFLLFSAVLGAGVLLAHIHYSIDVFAAPFITYSLFALCRRIFPRDYKMSRRN